jgi:hypothetical protein
MATFKYLERPTPEVASPSVDDLVSAQQDCFWDGHSEGFRDLEVHDQLEPRRPFNRKVGRLSAAQNPTKPRNGETSGQQRLAVLFDHFVRAEQN